MESEKGQGKVRHDYGEAFTDRDSVAELEAHGCADWLLVTQHGGGYDRRAQDGAKISVNAQEEALAYCICS